MIPLDELLTGLLVYGYPVLFGVVLVASLGAPLPASLTLLAAGGFVAQGELELAPAVAAAFGAAVIGDGAVYGLVVLGGEPLVRRHGARFGLGAIRLEEVRRRIGRWMSLSLFMTRWLLTPLALPTAVVAGLSGYRPAAYAASVAAGELLWTLLYIGLGYFFGESWPAAVEWVGDGAGLVAGLGVTTVAVVLLLRLGRAAKRP